MFEKIFKFENYYIFKVSLQKIEIRPKKPNLDYELIEINSLKELDNLLISNYNFDNLKLIEYFKRLFVKNSSNLVTEALHSILKKKTNRIGEKNLKIFLYFQDNFLIHVSSYSENTSTDNILNKFEGKSSVFIGPVFTNKKFRGKGFHAYDMVCRFNEYKSKGFEYMYSSSKAINKEAVFWLLAAGFKKILNIKYYKILIFRFYM